MKLINIFKATNFDGSMETDYNFCTKGVIEKRFFKFSRSQELCNERASWYSSRQGN